MYLGSTVQCNGGCYNEVKRRVQVDWNNWRVSRVICDRRLSACVKWKVYKTCHAVWFGDSTIDQETRSRTSGGRVEDVKIFFGSYENGQN